MATNATSTEKVSDGVAIVNEGQLKAKWKRHAEKHGFFCQSLSPHQIRGMPDLRVIDLAACEVMRGTFRVHEHKLEAKVARLGPRTEDAFSARRDATPHQVLWCLNDRTAGLTTWWLILSPTHWAIIPGDQLSLSREEWEKGKAEYGMPLTQLEEEESTFDSPRKQRIKERMAEMQENRQRVARLFDGGE